MSKSQITNTGQVTEIFKALSNPNRLRIFLTLVSAWHMNSGCISDQELAYYVGDLCECVEVSPSTVSHHLRELSHAGLIKMERCGQRICCSVNSETVAALSEFLTCLQRK
ncbi:helix-turn-helix transcriptional regulator [Candidatus Poribacteria bacterium]|nr:helix-turn-helix transcriptional regulator [Candidatus Poribacteria bacterium]